MVQLLLLHHIIGCDPACVPIPNTHTAGELGLGLNPTYTVVGVVPTLTVAGLVPTLTVVLSPPTWQGNLVLSPPAQQSVQSPPIQQTVLVPSPLEEALFLHTLQPALSPPTRRIPVPKILKALFSTLIFFLSFSRCYFSPRRGCRRVLKTQRGFQSQKNRILIKKKSGTPPLLALFKSFFRLFF